MRRAELEHAIRAACAIIKRHEVLLIGSQSILGSFTEDQLPALATLSVEADIMAIDNDPALVARLSDDIEGAAGELSLFHDTFGYYIDGVGHDTAVLPQGWNGRLVALCNANTNGCTGWCLEPHDLCVSKLVAGREKDHEFVAALVHARLIDPTVIQARAATLPEAPRDKVMSWISHYL